MSQWILKNIDYSIGLDVGISAFIMHTCFFSININYLCVKWYEIAACIINVWGYTGICRLPDYSQIPIIRTFKGKRKKFELSGVQVIKGKII